MDKKVLKTLKNIERHGRKVHISAVPRSTGELLRFLVLVTKSKKVLELGSSVGYSGVWLGSAVKELGGKMYTIEKSEPRSELARLNFESAGLEEVITHIEGDILNVLRDWKYGKVDFLFIDAIKRDYLEYYELCFDLVKKGGVIVADDVKKFKDKVKPFLDKIKKDKRVSSSFIDLDDGLLLIYKK
ncbi:O-methyltransferase [Nanoarchaeota archaeon]